MAEQDRPDPVFDAMTSRLLRREALRRAAAELNTTSPRGLEGALARISAEVTADARALIVALNAHFWRFSDLEYPDHLVTTSAVPVEGHRDSFGNWCSRLVAPVGEFNLGIARVNP